MIRVVIADDQMLIREGLGTILSLEEDIEVVALASNGAEACAMVAQHQPDLVMMDIQMPVMDGLEAIKKIKQDNPQVIILILSTYLEDRYIIEGIKSGAIGYLLKDMDSEKMIHSIRDAISGNYIISNAVAAKIVERISKKDSNRTAVALPRKYSLTERELELAQLMLKGYNNREISNMLNIAEGTVRNKISIIYSKLDVVDRLQAIAKLQEMQE